MTKNRLRTAVVIGLALGGVFAYATVGIMAAIFWAVLAVAAGVA